MSDQTSLFPDFVQAQKSLSKPRPAIKNDSPAGVLLREWYEGRIPRPRLANYPGARRIIAAFLQDWSVDQVQMALRSCNNISNAWLENSLRALPTKQEYVRQDVPDFFVIGEV